jgi:hypothetical protein
MRQFNPDQIRSKIDKLQSSRPKIFGASAHHLQLNPPLSITEILLFEQKFHVTLPPDYRQFLTSVGNGGCGPYYGIFPLGKMDDNFDYQDYEENTDSIGTLSKPFPFQESWNELSALPMDTLANENPVEYEVQIDEFESTYWDSRLMNGAIPICHEGCAIRIWLVLTGDQSGYLWEDRRSEYGGIIPVRLPNGMPASFIEWYEEWLDACLLAVNAIG